MDCEPKDEVESYSYDVGATSYRTMREDMIEDRERVRDPEKLSFIFENEALRALYEIAKRENKSLDEVIEDALGLRKWALDVRDGGGSIIVRREKEEDKELVI